ncbi:putative Ig domain-containing protein [Plantibacter sp. M259]|uniref:putative Ig domain-containing protein n=1 Tax=Plantibacter sp. M259 TaxID=2583822 RepID=UPI00143DC753|nr:putative Ig domain-containing protein [Plantibacter sp. M259]
MSAVRDVVVTGAARFVIALAVAAGMVVAGGTMTARAGEAAPNVAYSELPVGRGAAAAAVEPSTGDVYVTNSASATVSIIDGATKEETIISVGQSPSGIVFNPFNGYFYVAIERENTVVVVDPMTKAIIGGPISVGTFPAGLAVNPATGHVFVANSRSDTVSVIDPTTRSVIVSIPVGQRPVGVTYSLDANRIYVTNNSGASVSVIDGSSGLVVGTIAVGTAPWGIAIDPVTDRVYVANTFSNSVSVIDQSTQTVVGSPIGVGTAPVGVIYYPPTGDLYISNTGSSTVSVIDGASGAVIGSPIAVGRSPLFGAYNPQDSSVYIASIVSNSVSVLGAAPTIASAAPIDGTVGESYMFAVTADAAPSKITFNVSGGQLPKGLSMDAATGVIFGTPTAAGVFSFTVTATNIVGSDAASYVISVGATPSTPTSTGPAITSGSPSEGKTGSTYNHTVTATGTGPIVYAVSGGVLPPGLSLDPVTGVISGTPTSAGAYSLSISATDAAGSDTAQYTIVITADGPAPSSSPITSETGTHGGRLPSTGLEMAHIAGIASLSMSLLLAGILLVLRRRPRPDRICG